MMKAEYLRRLSRSTNISLIYVYLFTYVAKKVTFVPPVLSFKKLAQKKKNPEAKRLRSRSPKEQDPKMEYISVGFVKILTGED